MILSIGLICMSAILLAPRLPQQVGRILLLIATILLVADSVRNIYRHGAIGDDWFFLFLLALQGFDAWLKSRKSKAPVSA